jgi:adenylate cyclase
MEAMSPLVGEHGGVILRFIGDAIMAMFGVPVARTTDEAIRQDAVNAVSCALAMQQRLIELNRSLHERGLPMIGMRMGLLTGPMVAGTLGSAKRLEYNVHGDTVNTAARLESFDKEGFAPDHLNNPCRILIGQPTVDLVGAEFVTELVGEVRLKGKEHGTRIYRVLGPRDSGPGEKRPETQATDHAQARRARVVGAAPN